MSWGFSDVIHDLSKSFPKDALFVLASSSKPFTDAVALNTVGRNTLQSESEFLRFLLNAKPSAVEVVACLNFGRRKGLINEVNFDIVYYCCKKLIAMIRP